MESIHVAIAPETLFQIGNLPVTNTLLTSWVVAFGLIIGSLLLSRHIRHVPGRIQALCEMCVDGLLGFMTTVAGNKGLARKFFPFVATIFFFVLFSNWAGLIPGVGSIGFFETSVDGHDGSSFVPLFRSVHSDLTMTLALALMTVTLSHIVGFMIVGTKGHLGKFFNFHGGISFFQGILEIIGEISKIISLAFRLFGNVFAGEVLLVIVGSLVPYIVPIPFYGMELFVGFIQALVFAVLAMVALSSMSIGHDHSELHESHGPKHA